jgi:hypothetical protein
MDESRKSKVECTQAMAEAIKRIVVFCLERQGRCFKGWSADKIFKFLAWHYLNGSLFMVTTNEHEGTRILAVGVAWPMDAAMIRYRDAEGLPLFEWQPCDWDGDALLISTVFGERKYCAVLLKLALNQWPQCKTVFTYRRGVLVELDEGVLGRFCRAMAAQQHRPTEIVYG